MRRDLHELEQRWDLAAQCAGFGVWDLDIVGQRVHYSTPWKVLLGYGDEDVADSTATWRARVHPEDLAPMLAAQNAHIEGLTPGYATEFRLRDGDGQYRWVLSRGRVVERDGAGRALRAVGTLTDITDRRRVEELRLERDRAEAASRAKTEFLSRVSHELRTPLNAVLGFAQLLAHDIGHGDVERQRQHVAHIERSGWQLVRLIDEVLDISRIDANEGALRSAAVPLAPLMEAAAEAARAQAQAPASRLRCIVPEALATVSADADRLLHVVQHLLVQALRRAVAGCTTLEAHAVAGGWVLVIAPSAGTAGRSAVEAEPAAETAVETAAPTPGLAVADDEAAAGLGFALVRSLLAAMGGRLDARHDGMAVPRLELTLPAAAAAG